MVDRQRNWSCISYLDNAIFLSSKTKSKLIVSDGALQLFFQKKFNRCPESYPINTGGFFNDAWLFNFINNERHQERINLKLPQSFTGSLYDVCKCAFDQFIGRIIRHYLWTSARELRKYLEIEPLWSNTGILGKITPQEYCWPSNHFRSIFDLLPI